MKKIVIIFLLVFTLFSLSSCKSTSDFYYSLEGYIDSYEYEDKTILTLDIYMRRGGNRTGVGFAELDDGAFSYEGESIYKYIVYCNDKEIYFSDIIAWLKSLRPQATWKPSDKQMERLKGTINSLPHQEVLYSLYQDLKKLKEE
jgi:hypothetical protein